MNFLTNITRSLITFFSFILTFHFTYGQVPPLDGVTSVSVLKEGVTSIAAIESLTVGDKLQSSSYMDGLGRTIQSVAWKTSPNQNDVIRAVSYDHRGRVKKSYLPYVSSEGTGAYRPDAISGTYTSSEQYQFYQNAANVAHDTQPYTEVEYETSPMSRVLEQSAVGSAWTDKTTKADFRVNTSAADGSIYKWTLTNGLPELDGTYANAALMVSETEDADNRKVSTYTDKIGRTILKRVENGSDDRMTYYVYNDMDQLVFIIPPRESYDIINGATVDQDDVDNLLYHYTYDARGRVKSKETPDAGKILFVYDQYDRVVMTQDANQRAKSTPEWSFVKYDNLDRAIYTGIVATSDSQATLQSAANSNTSISLDSSGDYNDVSFPTTTAGDRLSKQYYDKYDFTGLDPAVYNTAIDSLLDNPKSPDLRVYGKPTRSRTRVLGDTKWLETINFYDEYGRVIQVQSGNHWEGTDVMAMEYDFAGRLLKAVTFYDNPHAEDVLVVRMMTYDHAGRLLTMDHQLNGGDTIRLASYTYNELGQVIDKKIHSTDGTTFKQSIDYTYNIRGWLTAINDAQLSQENDLFGMELLYEDASAGYEQYTGLLGEVKWKGAMDEDTKSYRYQYDALKQLTQADYGLDGSYTANAYGVQNLSYDRNGNILGIDRNGEVEGATQLVDDLSFTYTANQLQAVDDATTYEQAFNDREESAEEYMYDANGNMVKDLNKEMDTIYYNFMNRAEEVHFSDGRRVKYGYSAGGTLLWQEFYAIDTATQTEYLKMKRDFLGSQVFEDSVLVSLQTGVGRIVPVLNYDYSDTTFQDIYTIDFSSTPSELTDQSSETHVSNGKLNIEDKVTYTLGGGKTIDPGYAEFTFSTVAGADYVIEYETPFIFNQNGDDMQLNVKAGSLLIHSHNLNQTGVQVSDTFNVSSSQVTIRFENEWRGPVSPGDPGIGITFLVDNLKLKEEVLPVLQVSDTLYDYQYNLKDHQGNTRVTFSTICENYTMIETFETGENNGWQDLHRHTNTDANTTVGGDEVELLQSEETGAMIFLSMNKGDTVDLSVNVNYESAPSGNTFLGTAYNTLFTSFDNIYGSGVPEGGGVSSSSTVFDDALNGGAMAGKDDTNTAPRAFLNYIFFDEEMNYITAGFQQISTSAQGVGVHETISIDDIIADREGYILAYLSNENQEAVNVHFDDFTVYHGKTNVVQTQDYYPFGLSSSSYSRNSSLFNPYLYNQGSRLEEETEWYSTPFRKYDASIGRFTGVDALASSMASINSYHYAYNNPVNFSDPLGLAPMPTKADVRASGDRQPSGLGSWLKGRMNPLQGNYWTNRIADITGNRGYNLSYMSVNDFRERYDVENMTPEEKARFAVGLSLNRKEAIKQLLAWGLISRGTKRISGTPQMILGKRRYGNNTIRLGDYTGVLSGYLHLLGGGDQQRGTEITADIINGIIDGLPQDGSSGQFMNIAIDILNQYENAFVKSSTIKGFVTDSEQAIKILGQIDRITKAGSSIKIGAQETISVPVEVPVLGSINVKINPDNNISIDTLSPDMISLSIDGIKAGFLNVNNVKITPSGIDVKVGFKWITVAEY